MVHRFIIIVKPSQRQTHYLAGNTSTTYVPSGSYQHTRPQMVRIRCSIYNMQCMCVHLLNVVRPVSI